MGVNTHDEILFGPVVHHEHFFDQETDVSEDDILDTLEEEDEAILWDLEVESADLNSQSTSINIVEASNPVRNTRCTRDRQWVIARIEAMLEKIVDGLLEEKDDLVITLKSRAGLSRRRMSSSNCTIQTPMPKERDFKFPGSTANEAWSFTVLLRILELVHTGLIDNNIMTKRDLYYRHPDLFIKQSVVDRHVDDLACTFGITRAQLNITAAAKGLVAGNFNVTRENGSAIDGMKDQDGMLIPKISEGDTFQITSIHWILIIEKEATFRSLLSSPQWKAFGMHGLIMTAKGYPDVASRSFLHHIADRYPQIPMYALVDLDPDGIAILSTYKYGSFRLAHECAAERDTASLGLSNIQWLGVRSQHINGTLSSEHGKSLAVMPELQGVMNLTERDRTKARQMLEWNLCAEDGPEPAWRHELQTMLVLNQKAEMQILDELPGSLISWLNQKLETTGEQPSETVIDCASTDDGMLF